MVRHTTGTSPPDGRDEKQGRRNLLKRALTCGLAMTLPLGAVLGAPTPAA
jgi:hypothetical protein